MQAVFSEHLVKISPIPAGKLGGARNVAVGELQNTFQIVPLEVLFCLGQRLERGLRHRRDRRQEIRRDQVLA